MLPCAGITRERLRNSVASSRCGQNVANEQVHILRKRAIGRKLEILERNNAY